MKYLLTLFLLSTSIISFSQNKINYKFFSNNWTSGTIDSTGKVIHQKKSRGGGIFIHIKSDTTIEKIGPIFCGQGTQLLGKWNIDKKKSTITFLYSKRVTFLNNKSTEANIVEVYKIEKVTSNELILSQIIDGKKIIFPYLKTDLK